MCSLCFHKTVAFYITLSDIKLTLLVNPRRVSGFVGLEVACWPLVPKFAGSHPAEAVGLLGRKNPQYAFFQREVKQLGLIS
jgi:hypothetical protein